MLMNFKIIVKEDGYSKNVSPNLGIMIQTNLFMKNVHR